MTYCSRFGDGVEWYAASHSGSIACRNGKYYIAAWVLVITMDIQFELFTNDFLHLDRYLGFMNWW